MSQNPALARQLVLNFNSTSSTDAVVRAMSKLSKRVQFGDAPILRFASDVQPKEFSIVRTEQVLRSSETKSVFPSTDNSFSSTFEARFSMANPHEVT